MIANISPVLGEMIKHAGEAIQTEMYENPESSVKTCTVAFELFVKQAREARINSEFPTFGLGLFKKATAARGSRRKGSRRPRQGAARGRLIRRRYIDT